MNIEEVKQLLKHYGIQPRREQGQNFLIDDTVIEASLEAAQITKDDTVLEIGPGFGALTNILSERAGRVVAVEQDRVLAAGLQKQQRFMQNLTIINQDVRKANLLEAGLEDGSYKMVANLPYSITSWVIRHFLEHAPRPKTLTVLIQKEVAERMAATPGSMSVLSVATQLYTEPTIVRIVKPDSFYPAPKVDSAIIHLAHRKEPLSSQPEELMRLVNIGFSSKRKQLHNNLSTGLALSTEDTKSALAVVGLPENIRPQELSVQQWESLRLAIAAV